MNDPSRVVSSIYKLKDFLGDLDAQHSKVINDLFLLQSLKLNKMNVKQAEAAIRANLLWRKTNNIAELESTELCDEISKKLPIFIDLTCRDGGPFVYIHAGSDAIPKLWNKHGRDRLFRALAHIYVKTEQRVMQVYRDKNLSTEELVRTDRGICYRGVYDAKGFSWKQATCLKTLQFFMEFANLFVHYFPCFGTTGNVVNANVAFRMALRVGKPLLDSKGVQLHVHGGHPVGSSSELYDLIDLKTFREIEKRVQNIERF